MSDDPSSRDDRPEAEPTPPDESLARKASSARAGEDPPAERAPNQKGSETGASERPVQIRPLTPEAWQQAMAQANRRQENAPGDPTAEPLDELEYDVFEEIPGKSMEPVDLVPRTPEMRQRAGASRSPAPEASPEPSQIEPDPTPESDDIGNQLPELLAKARALAEARSTKRERFRPNLQVRQPEFMPDTLSSASASNTSAVPSQTWGKHEVNPELPLEELDESTVLKGDLRKFPILGWLLLSPELSLRTRFLSWCGLFLSLGLFAWGVVATAQSIQVALKSASTSDSTDARNAQLYAPVDLDKIDAVLNHFFTAPDKEAQLEWVRSAEAIEPLAANWPFKTYHSAELLSAEPLVALNKPFLDVKVRLYPDVVTRRVLVEQTRERDYRIDWESAVGYQEQAWDRFLEERPPTTKVFRVSIQKGDYYNGPFSDPNAYKCWVLADQLFPELKLHGYTELDSEETRQLERVTAVDGAGFAILGLLFPPEATAFNMPLVKVTRILQEGWLQPYVPSGELSRKEGQ